MKQFLKNNALFYGGVILLLVVVVRFAFDYFKRKTETIYKNLSESGSTYTDVEAKSVAEGLYNSMGRPGTDEEKIYDLLQGVSSSNFSKVYNAFGQRMYWHELGVWTDDSIFSNGHEIDLFGWLNAELEPHELAHLRSLAPDIFPK
ncbi:hypothetical protein [Tenacibaculum ovolyticum]|uniref:hypothetical protein n=1 Tax=Tenacibaculum ovolyticum TaxID=104270 RepID=UPI00041F1855|nr:hypothetical protein [Tenacibaculum ovolyticum]